MPARGRADRRFALAATLLVYMWNFKVRQIATALAVGSALVVGYIFFFAAGLPALWDSITGAEEDDSVRRGSLTMPKSRRPSALIRCSVLD